MSRAFVKEDVDLPERSGRKRSASGLPSGATNYVTARGAKRLRDEVQKLRAANANSERIIEPLQRVNFRRAFGACSNGGAAAIIYLSKTLPLRRRNAEALPLSNNPG
jgi:hypothetical protein